MQSKITGYFIHDKNSKRSLSDVCQFVLWCVRFAIVLVRPVKSYVISIHLYTNALSNIKTILCSNVEN